MAQACSTKMEACKCSMRYEPYPSARLLFTFAYEIKCPKVCRARWEGLKLGDSVSPNQKLLWNLVLATPRYVFSSTIPVVSIRGGHDRTLHPRALKHEKMLPSTVVILLGSNIGTRTVICSNLVKLTTKDVVFGCFLYH